MPESGPDAHAPAAVFRVPRASTVDLIAVELRAAIHSGALVVGGPIGEVEIASQLGVSRSPLREAAQRLVQEGLLTSTPGRGLRVATIRPEDLRDLYDARVAIESQAIRLVVARANARDIAEIEAALSTLMTASEGTDARKIGDADIAFHHSMVVQAGNSRLERYFSGLAIETRIASFSMSDGYVVRRDVSPSYRAIVDAIAAGDSGAAIAALESQMSDAVARLSGEPAEHGADYDTVEEPLTNDPLSLEPLNGR